MAEINAQSSHLGNYNGTNGDLAFTDGLLTLAASANDVVNFGKLPAGIKIIEVGAGSNIAQAGVTLDISIEDEEGTALVAQAGLDINNKYTVKPILPVDTGFKSPVLKATVKGGSLAASQTHVTVKYQLLGTQ